MINKQLKNPKSNKPLFKKVLKKEDIGGDNSQNVPDIIFILDEYSIASIVIPQIFDNRFSILCNNYDYYGIFFISGPGIKKNQEIKNAKIIDVAPTILHLFNISIPDDIDGRVLTECFEEDSKLAKREIVFQDIEKIEKLKDTIKRLKKEQKI